MVVVFIILGLDICVDEYNYVQLHSHIHYYDFWLCVTTSKFKVVTQYGCPKHYGVTTKQHAIATKSKSM